MPERTVTKAATRSQDQLVAALRVEMVEALRALTDLGLLTQTSGNVSVRIGPDQALITPSSMKYELIGPEDLVLVDLDGCLLTAPHRPSSELPLHLAVYASRPDLRAIVHTHSPMATTFAVLNMVIPAVHYMLTPLHQTQIEVCPYSVFGSQQLAESVRETFLAPAHAVLLANHGMVAGGATLAEACGAAETVELLAGLYHRALAVGTPHILTDQQIGEVADQIKVLTYGRISADAQDVS